MAELLNWVLFGALAGWITALMMRTDSEKHETIKQLAAGGFGALIGGIAYVLFASTQTLNGYRSGGLMVTIVASIVGSIAIGALANKVNISKRGRG